jgi:D,D-heptose 1,7-bisphosphate phosphatase
LEIIPQNKAAFIDRDGTINRDVPYCSRPEDFELLPGVGEGIRILKESGYKIIVVTNQSGIARGYFTEEILVNIHDKMRNDLAIYKASIDAIYYCPHHPDDDCDCRKPKPKMILDAARDLNIDISNSYVIGDTKADIDMGIRAGCKKSLKVNRNELSDPLHGNFDTFLDATCWLIANEKNKI